MSRAIRRPKRKKRRMTGRYTFFLAIVDRAVVSAAAFATASLE